MIKTISFEQLEKIHSMAPGFLFMSACGALLWESRRMSASVSLSGKPLKPTSLPDVNAVSDLLGRYHFELVSISFQLVSMSFRACRGIQTKN